MAEFAIRVNAACGRPVVFPPGSSIEGYAFEAGGKVFVMAEEMDGGEKRGQMKAKAGGGKWTAIDAIAGQEVRCSREAEYVVFETTLEANGATLFCLARRDGR
jgi:hypothetical protein